MGKLDKYIGKYLNPKNKKRIKEEFSGYDVYFHPENSLVMLDSKPNRIRVFYDAENVVVDISEG